MNHLPSHSHYLRYLCQHGADMSPPGSVSSQLELCAKSLRHIVMHLGIPCAMPSGQIAAVAKRLNQCRKQVSASLAVCPVTSAMTGNRTYSVGCTESAYSVITGKHSVIAGLVKVKDMTTSSQITKKSAFRQVSLPADFLEIVNLAAEASGRSAAKELEHAFRIAQALENFVPAQSLQAIKHGVMPARELLEAMLDYTASSAYQTALQRVVQANPTRIARDPSDPKRRIRTNADGTKEVGVLSEEGEFIPLTHNLKKDTSHERSKEIGAVKAPQTRSKSRGARAGKASADLAHA